MGNGASRHGTDARGAAEGGTTAGSNGGVGSSAVVPTVGHAAFAPPQEVTVNVVVPPPPQGDDEASPLGNVGSGQHGNGGAEFLGKAPPAKYIEKEMLGKGAFGEAFIVERSSDKKAFVGKVMNLHSMSSQDKRYAQTEILCLAHSDHFAIVQYVEHQIVDEDTVVIIMEYADNGDLYNNIKKRKATFTEREAGIYYVQLLLALDHIHRRRMIHRDIKSANIFMTKSGLVKLGDFGFSQQYDQTVSNDCAGTFLGTPYYLAPEMWRGNRYGKRADVWASAIVLFEFLTGGRPFVASSMPALRKAVLEGSYAMPDTLSPEMKDFVHATLKIDPAERPSAQDLLRTPLMQHYVGLLQQHVATSPLIDEATRGLIAANIEESMVGVRAAIATHGLLDVSRGGGGASEGVAAGTSVRYESVVYKECDGDAWKERYLILEHGYITLTLVKNKDAPGGGDKSKKIPTDSIISAVPVAQPKVSSTGAMRYAFAIATRFSSEIIFATDTEAQRDEWVQKLLEMLEMA